MIRKAQREDLDRLLELYAAARRYMAENGNPSQWPDGHPRREILEADIQAERLYAVAEEDGTLHGAFVFLVGDDPTYAVIEDGAWKNDRPYGTIHRLAGDGTQKGLFVQCLNFCKSIMPDIRADTHHDNHIMRYLLEKYGFQRCGVIYVEDGTPRIAYQYEAWA